MIERNYAVLGFGNGMVPSRPLKPPLGGKTALPFEGTRAPRITKPQQAVSSTLYEI